jgi:predicted TPR repeat methyltransferase
MNRKDRREQKSKIRKAGGPHPAYAEACARFSRGRSDEAQYYLKQVLAEEPRHADALHLLGVIALQARKYDAAATLIAQAITIRGDDPLYHNNLGLALMARGDLSGAEPAFARAIMLKPDFPEACSSRAEILVRLGRHKEGEELARRALTLRPGYVAAHCALAAALYGTGKKPEAEAEYHAALKSDPKSALAHHNLGRALYDRGDIEGATEHLNAYLGIDPADRFGARLLLAAVGKGDVPLQAPEAHMKHLYAQRAGEWDSKEDTYYAHALVADALKARAGDGKLDILDAGCGTGLAGARVKALAKKLDGIDISPEMLERASLRKIYDDLYCGDLVAHLNNSPGGYDAIVSAATLIHFGDLAPALSAAAAALRSSGVMVFTLFPNKDENAFGPAAFEGLAQGGCFAHGKNYVRRTAETAGFSGIDIAEAIHEHNEGKPITGLVVTLQKAGSP